MAKSPHEVLGVVPGTSLQDCRKAYHKQVRLVHPDKLQQGATAEELVAAHEQFRAVQNAYEALTDGCEGFEAKDGPPIRHSDKDRAKRICALEEEKQYLQADLAFANEQLLILQSAAGCFGAQMKEKAAIERPTKRQSAAAERAMVFKDLRKGLPGPGRKKDKIDPNVQRLLDEQEDHLRQRFSSCSGGV